MTITNRVMFYGTKNDLKLLLQAIESKLALKFITVGLFDSSHIKSKISLNSDNSLGQESLKYLIIDRELPFKIRKVPQKDGKMKYALDQLENPKTIVFQPSCEIGEKCLINGEIGTISSDPDSQRLFKLFSKEIRSQFIKIRAFYVGKEAIKLLDNGWRLTHSAETPAIYDLRRN